GGAGGAGTSVGARGGAVGAVAPVDDLGLVDGEAVRLRRGQAGGVADGAIDIGDRAAAAADDVVMVVGDPRLVAGDRAGGLDPPQQVGVGQRPQDVVDGLRRDVAEVPADGLDQR